MVRRPKKEAISANSKVFHDQEDLNESGETDYSLEISKKTDYF